MRATQKTAAGWTANTKADPSHEGGVRDTLKLPTWLLAAPVRQSGECVAWGSGPAQGRVLRPDRSGVLGLSRPRVASKVGVRAL